MSLHVKSLNGSHSITHLRARLYSYGSSCLTLTWNQHGCFIIIIIIVALFYTPNIGVKYSFRVKNRRGQNFHTSTKCPLDIYKRNRILKSDHNPSMSVHWYRKTRDKFNNLTSSLWQTALDIPYIIAFHPNHENCANEWNCCNVADKSTVKWLRTNSVAKLSKS